MSTVNPALISKLRRIANSTRPEPVEQCDFCGNPIPPDHRHFVEMKSMRFMCACEVCGVMQAEAGIYRPLPQRYLYLKQFNMPEELWYEFMIPVNMAFFVFDSGKECITAYYPAPIGATESQLRIQSWERLKRLNPLLGEMEHDLEALLINRTGEPYQHFIVPIDACYELVGLMKSTWQGMSGGDKALEAIAGFFGKLTHRCA